jgi:hypothetical protein
MLDALRLIGSKNKISFPILDDGGEIFLFCYPLINYRYARIMFGTTDSVWFFQEIS